VSTSADPVARIRNRVAEGGQVIPLPAAAFVDDHNHIVPSRLAEAIREADHVRVGHDGRLWRYEAGVYRPDGDRHVAGRVRELLGERFGRRVADEVQTYLRSFPVTVTAEPSTTYINCANGLLHLEGRELKPHDPREVSTTQIPVEWQPDARCPAVEAFLSASLPSDAFDLVLEVIGYALYPDNPYRRAVLLLGETGTGKSILLRLLRALLGAANCSAVPLQSLGENRFAAAAMFGKLANICGDLDARAVRRTDLFKQITGGDAIFAEHKGRDPFSFTSFALPIFSANEAPISSDQSEAWFDRWLIIPMDRRFAGTPDEDPELIVKLTAKPELEGLLVLAVEALGRLMARGRFDPPPSCLAAGARYRDSLDSARGFVAEMCVIVPEAWVARPVLYRQYRRWCQDSGRFPVAVDRFNDHLRKVYPMQVREASRSRRGRGWEGIGLVTSDEGNEP
jgi:putative DNA primase/helicase